MENKRMKKILTIMLFIIAVVLLNTSRVFASVEIKDANADNTATAVYTGQTISYFYDLCHQMTDMRQGLEGANVDVHMANNREWATVSYFSNSNYGTSGVGQNNGISITTPAGISRLSTNGNITGIMDWGKTITFTAGVIDNYSTSGNVYTKGKSLIDNLSSDTKIDKVTQLDATKMAMNRWYDSTTALGSESNYPYSTRNGLFGFIAGGNTYAGSSYGAASKSVTFRPVFYN